MKIRNKFISNILYWSPYIPVFGFIIVVICIIINIKNGSCIENSEKYYNSVISRKKIFRIQTIHFTLTLLIQMIVIIPIILYNLN